MAEQAERYEKLADAASHGATGLFKQTSCCVRPDQRDMQPYDLSSTNKGSDRRQSKMKNLLDAVRAGLSVVAICRQEMLHPGVTQHRGCMRAPSAATRKSSLADNMHPEVTECHQQLRRPHHRLFWVSQISEIGIGTMLPGYALCPQGDCQPPVSTHGCTIRLPLSCLLARAPAFP